MKKIMIVFILLCSIVAISACSQSGARKPAGFPAGHMHHGL